VLRGSVSRSFVVCVSSSTPLFGSCWLKLWTSEPARADLIVLTCFVPAEENTFG
jgi:hypothetical protein